jgi:16S rRNA (guanine527-N7)-methyltransferase
VSAREIGAHIRSRFKRFGIAASVQQIESVCVYFGLLTKWNRTVNLTGLQLEPVSAAAIDRLLVEPFLAAQALERLLKTAASSRSVLLDIGTGGGSPAIPLKVAVPGLALRMVESKTRKSAFLREVIRQLSLADTEVLTARTDELLSLPELHETADVVSVRAVKADRRFWNTLSAFTRPGGVALWFRSHADRERDVVFFPAFMLESVRPLMPAEGSELAILRKPRA